MSMRFESEPESTTRRWNTPESISRSVPQIAPDFELPHMAGNQAMQSLFRGGLILAKQTIGHVDDPVEHEADSVASQILADSWSPASGELQQSPIGRSSSSNVAHAHVPGLVAQVLRSSGHPLDAATRAFFEPRFGRNLSDVRIHAGSEAAASARSIQANAYTAGSDIVFSHGQFSPETPDGQRLLAHELAHVVQQDSGPCPRFGGGQSLRADRTGVIRRQPVGVMTTPGEISDSAQDQQLWLQRVDSAVRAQFGLGGTKLSSTNVRFLDEAAFARSYPRANLADALFYIFWLYGRYNPASVPGLILRINTGRSFELPLRDYSTDEIRDVVNHGLKDGYFWYHSLPTIDERGSQKITPRRLVTDFTAGITELGAPGTKRSINVKMSDGIAMAGTLVHEACHFYVSDAYLKAARARRDGDQLIGFAMISKILMEGFAEYFAREVMAANPDFGPQIDAYQLESDQVARLVLTLGEDTVRNAYFKGVGADIVKLMATVDQYKKTNPDLLIPR